MCAGSQVRLLLRSEGEDQLGRCSRQCRSGRVSGGVPGTGGVRAAGSGPQGTQGIGRSRVAIVDRIGLVALDADRGVRSPILASADLPARTSSLI
jgi:hypothetical protein